MSIVRSGDQFMLLPESYRGFKDGIATAEFLLRSGGFNLTAPAYFDAGILTGSKH